MARTAAMVVLSDKAGSCPGLEFSAKPNDRCYNCPFPWLKANESAYMR